ncbi:MAG: TIGR03643 family protein [Cyclobacteriaceae bacterium]|nr:TIGR03643 family protein [Cyclobacteriaceae bacterium]
MRKKSLTLNEIDRIIEMAWEDRTPFEAIEQQFGLLEKEVIVLMRSQMKDRSFRMWRKRTNGRATKHQSLGSLDKSRFKSTMQKSITANKISKR